MLLPRGPILHLPNRQGKNAGTLPSGSISLAFPGCLFSLWAQSTRYWAGHEKAWSQTCPLALKPWKALGRWKLPMIWLAPAGLDQVQIASFTFIQTTAPSQITPQHSADLFVGLTSTCSTPKSSCTCKPSERRWSTPWTTNSTIGSKTLWMMEYNQKGCLPTKTMTLSPVFLSVTQNH